MNYIRFIRKQVAHEQESINSFGLNNYQYHIKINNTIQTFNLNEIKGLESTIHQFYLWNKGLIARKFYQNDDDLFSYLN